METATNITELAQFFPAGKPTGPVPAGIRGVVWHKGETYEQAVENHEAKAARIQAQIERKALAKQAAAK